MVHWIGTGLLAELDTIGIIDQWKMQVGGCGESKTPLQVKVGAGILKQVGTTYDLGDPLQFIVHHHGKMIGIDIVAATQYEITDRFFKPERKVAIYPIVKTNFPCRHSIQAQRATALGESFVTAVAGINLSQWTTGHGLFAQRFAAALAGVTIPLLQQLFEIVLVMFKAIALIENGSIPLEAEGFQVAQDLIAGTCDHARSIDIFDTQ